MARGKEDIEFIVCYEPDRECEVKALLAVLGYGKAHTPGDESVDEGSGPHEADAGEEV